MNFKDWITNEALRTAVTASTEDIEFLDTLNGYTAKFLVDGNDYTVSLTKKDAAAYGLPTIWSITLKGPQGYSLVGGMGAKANLVYGGVIKAIRLLMQKETVEAIHFVHADESTIPVYDMLYRKFILPEPPQGIGFIKTGISVGGEADNYLSKAWLRANKERMTPSFLWGIIHQNRQDQEIIRGIKADREERRKELINKRIIYKKYIGKYILINLWDNPEVGYVIDVDSGYYDLKVVTSEGVNVITMDDVVKIIKDAETIQNFKDELSPELAKYLR